MRGAEQPPRARRLPRMEDEVEQQYQVGDSRHTAPKQTICILLTIITSILRIMFQRVDPHR